MKKPSVLLLSVAALLLVLLGLFTYRSGLERSLSTASCESIESVVEQQQLAFTAKLREQRNIIKTYARFFKDPLLDQTEILGELNAIAQNSTFNYMSYVASTGDGLRNTGEQFNIAGRDYFQSAMSGDTIISGPVASAVTGEPIITFSTPILSDGQVIGVLNGVYDAQYLATLLPPSFSGTGYTYITTQTGEVIAKTQGSSALSKYNNLFDVLVLVEHKEFDGFDQIMDNISNRRSGHSHYSFEGDNRFLHYAPLKVNDWYLFTVVPETVVAEQSLLIMRNTGILILAICFIFALIFLYFYGEHQSHIKELTKIAYIDQLTGIYNKRKFGLAATALLRKSSRNAIDRYAIAMLDIDKFKVFNDTLGYERGDRLLIAIADILRENARPGETFGRGDSDQFFFLMQYENDAAVRSRLDTILSTITLGFRETLGVRHYSLVICAGIYVINDPTEPISSISDKAKHALQLVKGSQVNSIAFYSEEMRLRMLKAKQIENHMHDALAGGEFQLYLQPKYHLRTAKIYGGEALVRWNYGNEGLVCPNEFIPLFEKNGFVTKLDMYMLEQTCIFIQKQLENGIAPIPISINFSRLHLKNPYFVDEIAAVVQRYQIPTRLIEIELTESTMHENENALITVLEHLHQRGFTLSMDDFGTGYSSLGLLKNLPVDAIKLDRTFFTQYTDLKRAKTVIANMIAMTRELGIYTVAEGVETQESIDLLKELGCDIVQGYYFAKPMEAEKMNELLREGKGSDERA